jgi:hypothetical protein
MSTHQRNADACTLVVSPDTADVLRLETKKVLMFGHDYFEDFLDFGPEAQYALAMRYRDAIDVVSALGWDPNAETANTEAVEVRLTDDLIEELRRRRFDLACTNRDRLDGLDLDEPIAPDLLTEITDDRLAGQALDRLFGAYERAISA